MENYNGYTAYVPIDPTFYGPETSDQLAGEIAERLSIMIQAEFPGITVLNWADGTNPGKTTGPDDDTVRTIDTWIEDNWTSAI